MPGDHKSMVDYWFNQIFGGRDTPEDSDLVTPEEDIDESTRNKVHSVGTQTPSTKAPTSLGKEP